MSRDESYQPRNYMKQKSGTSGDVWEIGGSLSFYGEEYTGQELRAIGRNLGSLTITNLSTGSTVLSDNGDSSPPVLQSIYGAIHLSVTGTMTNGSARLFSALKGQHLYLNFTILGGGSAASLLIYASGHASGISGVRVLASTGSDLSSISIRQSAASMAWMHLLGVDDGVWAVVGAQATVTEQPA